MKIPMDGPAFEEKNGANLHALWREWSRDLNSHAAITNAISEPHLPPTTHYTGIFKGSIRSWDPLRGDPAFQKLCQEKQPAATPQVPLEGGRARVAFLPS